mmetsp:Transcript_12882/g.36316  ORF Transcript_12882/g.36316 Transcript_12882/m.36316 type:complete len:97 (+) Transcript_12882:285-575(+)
MINRTTRSRNTVVGQPNRINRSLQTVTLEIKHTDKASSERANAVDGSSALRPGIIGRAAFFGPHWNEHELVLKLKKEYFVKIINTSKSSMTEIQED